MKYLFFFLVTIPAFAANGGPYPAPTQAKDAASNPIDYAFDISNSTVYKNSSLATSTDPFAGKVNKYAETSAIQVICTGAAAHVKFGSSAPTATTSDYLIPANWPTPIKIDENKPYMALIQDAASAVCYTVELK